MTEPEPERAEEFREAIAKLPSRSFRPNKKQTVSGLAVILAVAVGLLRFATAQTTHRHGIDNTAYLQCIAQAQTAQNDPTNLGFPDTDPSSSFPGDASDPLGSGQAFNNAVISCAQYPH
jgi:hypothetical protein